MESLSGSLSSIIIRRWLLCERLGRRGGDDGGFLYRWSPLREGVVGVTACNLMRVGACADELCLMGVVRVEVFTLVGRVGGGVGSLSKKSLRACGPPAIMLWSGCGVDPEGKVRIARRRAW
jgi:hypothetical protein